MTRDETVRVYFKVLEGIEGTADIPVKVDIYYTWRVNDSGIYEYELNVN